MAITGSTKETVDYSKKVGYFEGKVIAINPDREELEEILGTEIKKDPEYLGESGESNKTLRLSIWVQDLKTGWKQPINFFLENVDNKISNSGNYQFVNSQGKHTWASSVETLPEWFTRNGVTVRKAKRGEADVLTFLSAWLKIDRDQDFKIELPWEDLMKGKVKELRDILGTTLPATVISVATVRVKQGEDNEIKEYQGIYNRNFLPGYLMSKLRSIAWDKETIKSLKEKEFKTLKYYEKFVLSVIDEEHGIKEFYGGTLEQLKDYNPSENVVTSGSALLSEADSPEYD